ncbi:MAG: hypothetical protein U9N59_09550, partial [Campylobacterota bacterium]|nr:hypothetical protein [Campylobacterota bacterium]
DYTKIQLETKNTDIEIENDTPKNEKLIKNIEQDDIEDVVEKELSQEDEIKNALKSIESMNFDDEMKKAAEEKIKEKILQQRKIRAEQLALKSESSDEEEQEELEIEQNIEEEKIKKERELKEFWD